MEKKIFWIHPQLRNYRLKLFDIINKKYNLTFYLLKNSKLDKRYKYITRNDNVIINTLDRSTNFKLKDMLNILNGVKNNDVVITSGIGSPFTLTAFFLTKLFRKNIIIWNEEFIFSKTLKQKIKYTGYRIICSFVDAFYVMGPPQIYFLKKLGVKEKKIFVSNEYPEINYNKLAGKSVDLIKSDLTLLYIGRFDEVKGIPTLLKALNLLKNKYDISLNLVGYGPLISRVNQIIRNLDLKKIKYLGKITDPKKKSFLFKNVDALVVPSIIHKDSKKITTEGGPLVVIEAFSAGTPVIGTNALGNVEQFIKEGITGFIANQNDEKDLANKIELFYKRKKSGNMSNSKILNEFEKIPNHTFQAKKLEEAISFVSSK